MHSPEETIVKKFALMIAAGAALVVVVGPASAETMVRRDAMETRGMERHMRDAHAHMHHGWHRGWHHGWHHHHHHRM
jgi:hypothetical protein